MAKVFLAHKKGLDDATIDEIMELMRETWEDETSDNKVTSGRDFYKECVDNGEFEGWPQWNYKVATEFDVYVTPEETIGRATFDMFDRILTEGTKEVWLWRESQGDFVQVTGVVKLDEGKSWQTYARVEYEEGGA